MNKALRPPLLSASHYRKMLFLPQNNDRGIQLSPQDLTFPSRKES